MNTYRKISIAVATAGAVMLASRGGSSSDSDDDTNGVFGRAELENRILRRHGVA